MTDSRVQTAQLTASAEDVLPEARLVEQLASGDPLRVKFGIDPTAPDIHLGHVVLLNKLAQFQQAGHTVVLIIGDFTARVGDPSGRDSRRPVLSPEQIDENGTTFQDQAFKVLDRARTEVVFNSEWLDMPAQELFELVGKVTVARLLERDDFTRRMEADQPISALELLYPILQGYDSVAVRADVELGGTDQRFNLLFARDVQRAYGVPEQSILTMPILPGLDGKRRMSKSLDNYVGITEAPEEMFGKLMSIPDEVMGLYYELLLNASAPSGHPGEAKRALARRIVERFHDPKAAEAAEAHFDRVHVERQAPDDIPDVSLGDADGVRDGQVHLPALIAGIFEISTSEARRLIDQGGVKLDGESVPPGRFDVPVKQLGGRVLQVGKRRFARLIAP
jgi:tyrosyl-tRNA synthetase